MHQYVVADPFFCAIFGTIWEDISDFLEDSI